MIVELPVDNWSGPFAADIRARAVSALEQGGVLFFPRLSFDFMPAEKRFLEGGLTDGNAKNISLDPANGKLQGTSLGGTDAAALAGMIERFGAGAADLIAALLPYRGVERARTSYRPVQVKDRSYSRISDDRLLHIDAFPSRPMQAGRRILRLFANVAPASSPDGGARHWRVGEPFDAIAAQFLPRLKPHAPGKSWLYSKLGVTRGKRSVYDEMMLSLHDAAKLDDAYQKNAQYTAVDFPAGSCWLVFTDQVAHAALGGEFALEQTFHLDVDQMTEPARAPIRVLERLSGRVLA